MRHSTRQESSTVDALETMLSKIVQSPYSDIRHALYPRYHDKDDFFTLSDRAW